MTSVLETRAVAKRFGPVEALRGVSFAVKPGEIRALCGENGAGKSTLVKLLTGLHEPDSGVVLVDGTERRIRTPQEAQALGIAYVSQELSIAPHLSVLDNIWLGHRDIPFLHRRRALRKRARQPLEVVGLGGLSLDGKAGDLSLGQRQLLEIARMLVRDARVLILDEPTATLSDGEIARVFATLRRLRENGQTVIFITHRLGEVFDICDSVTVLRNGGEVGSYAVAQISRPELIELMLGRPLGEMYPATSHPGGDIVLSVNGLSVPGALERLSFDIPQGRIACLAGQIGSGAAETVRALAGLVYQASGRVMVNGKRLPLGSVPQALARNVRFVSEDRGAEGLFLDLPVRENLVATRISTLGPLGSLSRRRLHLRARELAASVGIDERRLKSKAGELSGGNQQKVSVGRSFTSDRAGVLLMNEPTRGVDVGARADIYALMRQLCDRGVSILMSSSDIEEVVGMSDMVITLYRGAKVAQYDKAEISRSKILVDILHQRTSAGESA